MRRTVQVSDEMWKFFCLTPFVGLVLFSLHHRMTESKFWLEGGKEVRELRSSLFNQLQAHSDELQIKNITIPSLCNTYGRRKKIGEGWQKLVYEEEKVDDMSEIIIKVPNLNGPTYISCLQRLEVEMCRLLIVRNLLREIRWMVKLQNDVNVIQIKSYCIPSDPLQNIDRLAIRTEKGEPLTTLFLIQQPWIIRLRIVQEIVRFLLRNPNIAFNDFRRQQFVVINGHPKLVDLDGITFGNFDVEGEVMVQKIKKEFVNTYLLLDIPIHLKKSFNVHKINTIRTLKSLEDFLNI